MDAKPYSGQGRILTGSCLAHSIETVECWTCSTRRWRDYYESGRFAGRIQGVLLVLAVGAIGMLLRWFL